MQLIPVDHDPWAKFPDAPQPGRPARRVFTIQTPAGKILDIEADDEASALAGAQQWHAKQTTAGAPGSAPPRQIEFEGRRIEVPADATNDEVRGILERPHGTDPWAQFPDAPPIQAHSADGVIHEFPAGTDMAVVDRTMLEYARAPRGGVNEQLAARGIPGLAASKAPPAPKQDIVMDALRATGGVVGQTVKGTAEGAAGIVGLPATLLGALGDAAPAGPIHDYLPLAVAGRKIRDFFGGEALKGYMDTNPTPPANVAERFGNRIGQEIGGMAVPAAGVIAKARSVGLPAIREGGDWLVRTILEPAAVNAPRYAAKEAAAATAFGTGAAGVNEVLPADTGPWKRALTELAGGGSTMAAVGAVKKVLPKAWQTFNAVRGDPNYIDQVVKDEVTARLAENFRDVAPDARNTNYSTDPIVRAIEEGRRVGDAVPGFQESLADRTRNPGLAALEYSRQSGPNAGMFTERRGANNSVVEEALQRSAPNGNPGAVREALESERDLRLGAAASATSTAQQQFDEATRSLNSVMTAEGRGGAVRSALQGASDAARDVVRRAWEPINRSAAQVDVEPLAQRFEDIASGMGSAERRRFLPPEAGDPAALAENGTQPIREVTGIRNALSDARLKAPENSQERRVLTQHIEALDRYVGEAVPAELRQQYEGARAARRDVADRFERPTTAVAQVLDQSQGRYRVPENDVTRRFVPSDEGSLADFRDLMRETGANAGVRSALRDQILHDVQKQRLLDEPEKLNRYLADRQVMFSDPRFSDLRESLGTAGGLRRQLEEVRGAETGLRRELGTPTEPGRGTVGRYLKFGDESSERAMRGVMSSPKPGEAADELLRFAGDRPEAVEGARQIFWDILQKEARSGGNTTRDINGRQPWLHQNLRDFLDEPRNAAVAARLYRDNPEHLENLRKVADALQGVDRRNAAKAGNTSGTAQGLNSPLTTPETLQSRLYAYKRGQVSGSFLVTSIGAVIARRAVKRSQQAAIDSLLDRALLDPDAAALLLRENNPANRAAMQRSAKLWLGNRAGEVAEMLSDDEDDDPVVAAVKRGG